MKERKNLIQRLREFLSEPKPEKQATNQNITREATTVKDHKKEKAIREMQPQAKYHVSYLSNSEGFCYGLKGFTYGIEFFNTDPVFVNQEFESLREVVEAIFADAEKRDFGHISLLVALPQYEAQANWIGRHQCKDYRPLKTNELEELQVLVHSETAKWARKKREAYEKTKS